MGVRDDGVIVLPARQIDRTCCSTSPSAGRQLCGPRIAWEDRVRDVERIEVR
jgi:hypothetical protein